MRCLHCDKNISNDANVCPYCVSNTQSSKQYKTYVDGLSAIIVGLSGLVWYFVDFQTAASAMVGLSVFTIFQMKRPSDFMVDKL